ncbi:ABC transporter substrate-binding protein [Herbiconiux ginsengi]|uniref:Peptide/nickel transport system substrate-binding protein n=1 Tax=Herbiconiux ginsengi TaxID=381665 RepID=A0A1H3THV5_9MICO|nr:ABC transporter substrate-binding protein [Herbiconiux ginsengi]SDZ49577.1 peptide/nickel transport system substrate-binding protein [Herbiconiux ginsengi]
MLANKSFTLIGSGVSVMLIAALTGCSASGGVPGASKGGELRLALLGDISTPDPDTAYDGSELNIVNSAYEGLLGYVPGKQEPELTGVLATEWTASANNTVFTFRLREGVTFHDGTPFTADAIQSSFDRRNAIGEGPSYMTAGVASVVAADDFNVTITLRQPNSSFLDLLASPFGPKMISPTALKEHPVVNGSEDWFDSNDAGTGPYTYGAFAPGTSYQLNAYGGYWGDAPGYDAVSFDVFSNSATIQLELQDGGVDGLIGYADASTFDQLKRSDRLSAYAFPSMETPTMFVNPQSPDLADPDVRRSFISSIDFNALADTALADTATPTDGVFPTTLLPANLNTQAITYNPNALAQLAKGQLAGSTITIAYAQAGPAAQALSDNLAAVLNGAGIAAESVGYDTGSYYAALTEGAAAPDITFYSGFPDTASPEAWAFVFYTPAGGLDLFGADVPGVADLIDQATVTGDDALYGDVAQRVSESGYWRSVATSLGLAVFQKGISGVDRAYSPVITGILDIALIEPPA